MSATEVIIFFVGLTLWSEPSSTGVKALLPRVVHSKFNTELTHHHQARTLDDSTAVSIGDDVPHVQNHRAAIVFYAASFVQQSGWGAPEVLPSREANDPAFRFIRLRGETVTFDTNGVSNGSASLAGVPLPRLKQHLCPGKLTLRQPYQSPFGGAAAVVELPEGTLQACVSLPADSPGRIDTRVSLQTGGTLVIRGSGNKELHLVPHVAGGPIELMIANVPEEYYQNNYATPASHAINGMSHERAYHAMSDPDVACTKVEEWWHAFTDPDSLDVCDVLKFPASGPVKAQSVPTTAMVASGASFDCSNTGWP